MKGGAPILLPLVPLRDVVVFPHRVAVLVAERDRSVEALLAAKRHAGSKASPVGGRVFLAVQRNDTDVFPGPDDVMPVGTIADLLDFHARGGGVYSAFVEGVARGRIIGIDDRRAYLSCSVEHLPERQKSKESLAGLARIAKAAFAAYAEFDASVSPTFLSTVANSSDPGRLADLMASGISLSRSEAYGLVRVSSVRARLQRLVAMLAEGIDVLPTGQRGSGWFSRV